MLILSKVWLLCCQYSCKALAEKPPAISPCEHRTFCARRCESAMAELASLTNRELVWIAVISQAAVE
jgi:hypothetical protein